MSAMNTALRPVAPGMPALPALIYGGGEQSARRFVEYFVATIRNPNTRAAYYRAVCHFLAWCEAQGIVRLQDVQPIHVATYLEVRLGEGLEKPSVKQALAAIRMCFDYLVTGQILAANPAHAVRGPKHSVKRGKTPVLAGDQARDLMDGIAADTLVGRRDRALIAVMVYTFARVGAVVGLRVEDYFADGKRWWLQLHEKGGKLHRVPVHHKLEAYLDDYLVAAGHGGHPKAPLFRTAIADTGRLSDRPMHRNDVFRMIGRRAPDLRQAARIGCHTFRATGITAYLDNGGLLEQAQAIAAHESLRTTQLYDRRSDLVSLSEIEKIAI
jgi:site-specific recombinase XerD